MGGSEKGAWVLQSRHTRPPCGEGPVRVSVIVPTWNERENVGHLLDGIGAALKGSDYEVVVVDDGSPDGTAEVVAARAALDPPPTATNPTLRWAARGVVPGPN